MESNEPTILKKHRKDEIRNHGQTVPTLTESRDHHGGANPPLVMLRRRNEFGKKIRKEYESKKKNARMKEIRDWVAVPQKEMPTLTGVELDRMIVVGDASGTATSTSTPPKSITRTSKRIGSQLTLEMSPAFPNTTSSALDSHVSLFQLLDDGRVSRILAELSSMKSVESPRDTERLTYSLRTSKGCSLTIEGERSKPSSRRWMRWGIVSNGRCLTANTTESRRIGSECSLSQVLETDPPRKYFLSDKAVKGLLKWNERQKKEGRGWATKWHRQSPTKGSSGEEAERQ